MKRPERSVDIPLLSSAEVKERVEIYLYSPLWTFIACSSVNFTIFCLTFFRNITQEKDRISFAVLVH